MSQFISADTLESTQIRGGHKSCIVWVKHVLAALEQVGEEAAPVCKWSQRIKWLEKMSSQLRQTVHQQPPSLAEIAKEVRRSVLYPCRGMVAGHYKNINNRTWPVSFVS